MPSRQNGTILNKLGVLFVASDGEITKEKNDESVHDLSLSFSSSSAGF
jgi:hypothetical protein